MQLIVNGRKLERKRMPLNGHLEWETVYEPGYVKAVGYRNGKKVMEERIETASEAVKEVWEHETVGDIMIANVKLCDSKGRFVPTACQDLVFEVPEGYRILGWGNGDPAFRYIERPVKYGAGAAGPETTPVPDRKVRTMKIRTFNGLAAVVLGN